MEKKTQDRKPEEGLRYKILIQTFSFFILFNFPYAAITSIKTK